MIALKVKVHECMFIFQEKKNTLPLDNFGKKYGVPLAHSLPLQVPALDEYIP